jgi:hypothetical protein
MAYGVTSHVRGQQLSGFRGLEALISSLSALAGQGSCPPDRTIRVRVDRFAPVGIRRCCCHRCCQRFADFGTVRMGLWAGVTAMLLSIPFAWRRKSFARVAPQLAPRARILRRPVTIQA